MPVGGQQLLILNSEFRIPVPLKKGLGIAAFYDGGNVFQTVGFHDVGANSRLSNTEADFRELCAYLARHRDRIWTAPVAAVTQRVVSWRANGNASRS